MSQTLSPSVARCYGLAQVARVHALLQILSLTLFEKLPLKQAVSGVEPIANNPTFHSQLNLFEF